MTFNPDAKIDPSKASRRGGRTGIAVGGGSAVVVIGLFLLSQLLGVDLTGLAGGGGGGAPPADDEEIANCTTGEQANQSIDCRMAATANSLDTYWSTTLPQMGVEYVSSEVILFTGQVGTGCGGASSAVGPFYCPGDQMIYLDTAFFDQLSSQFGASNGTLAEMYVLAHEWGHHVQNISGIMNGLDMQDTGPNSDAVRLEVQADCFAGAWVGAAQETLDEDGQPFLQPVTDQQINDALSAAAAVGDDRIQETTTGQVNPERWTHGSSEMRQRWFNAGLQGGPNACNTFEVPNL
jgi:predicted metalloprotease